MSGVFGVVSGEKYDAGVLTSDMAKVMSHHEWYIAETYADRELGISFGRIGIGIFNKDKQPIWNADQSIGLVMAGEFYNPEMCKKGETIPTHHERIALSYYEKYGEDFSRYLNGAFIIAILDKKQKKLIITNDRFGLYPLYYTNQRSPFIFAPEIKGILCDHTIEKKLDFTALAQYMRFQHLLGKRTFFENIEFLPYASLLVYDLERSEYIIRPYWSFSEIEYCPKISLDEAVEETGRLLRCSVKRLSGDEYRPGVFLSGGMDSRTILGLSKRRPMASVTWGPEDCRDVRYARRIARAVGSENHWFDLTSGKWVEENAGYHLELTEGYHSWVHMHGINVLPDARQWMDVNLTGWDGGTVIGHYEYANEMMARLNNNISITSFIFWEFNQKRTWPSITEAEEMFLYTEPLLKQVRGLAFESFRTEFETYQQYRNDLRAHLFFLINHTGRLTNNMITVMRSHIEVRFPFFDYDLIDFIFSLPIEIRCQSNFYRAILHHELPRLALIPYDHDQFLPTSNKIIRGTHASSIKVIRRVRKAMGIHQKPDTLYADYENYLRNDLKSWGESILFHPSVKEHGIFNPAFIQSIWERHQSGLEEWTIGKIAPIMTYEMMLRRFMD